MVSYRKQSGYGPGRVCRCILPLAYLALFASANAASSDTRGNARLDALPVEALVSENEFPVYERPSESSDGEWVAYCVTATTARASRARKLGDDFQKTGVNSIDEYGDIWITNVKTGRSRSITGGIGSNWSPVWSPDGHYLAFYSDRPGSGAQGQTKLWMWDRATDKLMQISDVAIRATREPVWLPSSDGVLTTTLPQGDLSQASHYTPPDSASIVGFSTEHLSTVRIYQSAVSETKSGARKDEDKTDGFQNLTRPAVDISIIRIPRGDVQRVVRDAQFMRYAVSPDCSHVVTSVAKRYATKGGYPVLFDLIDYDLSSGSRFEAATDVVLNLFHDHVSWSPNDLQFSYRTSGPEGDGSIYVVDVRKKLSRLVAAVPPGSAAGQTESSLPLWDSAGRKLYFLMGSTLWRTSAINGDPEKLSELPGRNLSIVSREGNQVWATSKGKLMLRGIDPVTKRSVWYLASEEKNSFEVILAEDKAYAGYSLVSHDARHLIYLAEDTQDAPDLWLANADFSERRRLTEINPQLATYIMGQSQLIEWQDINGQRLQGAILLPAGYVKNKKYPLLLDVYGGQRTSDDKNRFGMSTFVNGQLFATRGYLLMHPDAPQSVGTPMADLMKTIMPGVQKAIDLGLVDADRIGVMGQSYGGYSVLSLLVQTTHFKAAVEVDGMVDLVGSYGQMSSNGTTYLQPHLEHGQGLMGGTLWSNRDRYIENSPVFYLDRVNTPVLLIQGAEDSAVSASQADELFVDLRRLGKEAMYAKYMGEDHSPIYWSHANQVDFVNRMIDWFDVHLKH